MTTANAIEVKMPEGRTEHFFKDSQLTKVADAIVRLREIDPTAVEHITEDRQIVVNFLNGWSIELESYAMYQESNSRAGQPSPWSFEVSEDGKTWNRLIDQQFMRGVVFSSHFTKQQLRNPIRHVRINYGVEKGQWLHSDPELYGTLHQHTKP